MPSSTGPVPGDVKKAIEYLRRNLGRRFATGDLAAACGVAERTLRKHFRTFVGLSPLAYLRRLRLDATRAELLNATSVASVTEVAARNGFSHFGRFSLLYRRRFGEAPSCTLARSRAAAGSDRSNRDDRRPLDTDRALTAPRQRPGLVVLPFRYRGAAAGEEMLDGVVEAVRSALARVGTFFVFARGSMGALGDGDVDVGEIARTLGARYVIQGSMRAAAGRFRICVQLTDAVSRAEIWSAPFEGQLGDPIETEERIANAIAGALQPAILMAEVGRVQSRRPDTTDAYAIVLQAMPLCWALDRAACDTAIRLLAQAVKLDPGYAFAQGLLSWCHGQQAVYNWTAAPDAHRQRALGIARDAALLDRNDALALTALASAECVAGDLSAAAVHIGRALAIDPSSAWGWTRSGYIHCDLGKPDLALADFERALRLSPLDPMRHNAMIGTGFAYLLDQQYEAAVTHIEHGLVESPGSIWANRELAAAAAMTGDRQKAARCVAIVEGYAPGIRVSSILDAIPIRCDRRRAGFGRALARAGFSA